MKKFLIVLFTVMSFNLIAQDTIKLPTVEINQGRTNKVDPITLTTLTTDSLSYQGKDPFYTLNRYVPNVIAQSDNGFGNGYCYMKIRGIDQTRINYTLNGIPMNEMEDQGIFFSNMPGFYTFINSIQVQRGVGSSKYGTTGIGGSVDMETITPFVESSNAQVSYGSYQTITSNLNYNSGLYSNGFAFSLGGAYGTSDGFKHNSGDRGGSGFYQLGYFGKKDVFKVYGFSGGSNNQMAYIGVDMSTLLQDYRTNYNQPQENDTFHQNFVALSWTRTINQNYTVTTSAYFNNLYGHYTAFVDGSAPYGSGLGVLGVTQYQTGIMSNMTYQKNGFTDNFGLNYNYYQREHFGPLTYDTLYNVVNSYSNTGYKQDFNIKNKITYNLGYNVNFYFDLQYRIVNLKYVGSDTSFTKTWNFVNPKLGIKYLGKNTSAYLSFAFSEREPTRMDMFNGFDNLTKNVPTVNGSVLSTNTVNSLVPEKVLDIELGTNIYRTHGLQMSLNYYFMRFWDQYVATGELTPIGNMVKVPVFRSFRTGLEVEVSYQYKGLDVATNLSASDNEVFNGQWKYTPYASPAFTMNNFTSYQIRGVFFGVDGNMVSKQMDYTAVGGSNLTIQPTKAYYILNATVGYQIPHMLGNHKLTITGHLNNFTNQKYYIPAGVYGGSGTYYVGALMNYSLSLKFNL